MSMQVEHKIEKGIIQFRLIPNDGNPFTTGITEKNPIQEGFEFIGLTSEITEEQAKMMGFESQNYSVLGSFSVTVSCKDVFKLTMQHEEVYEVNPYQSNDVWQSNPVEYNRAQSRTGKWIVLFKPEI